MKNDQLTIRIFRQIQNNNMQLVNVELNIVEIVSVLIKCGQLRHLNNSIFNETNSRNENDPKNFDFKSEIALSV